MTQGTALRAAIAAATFSLICAALGARSIAAETPHDLALRDGYIVDGSGQPGYVGDVIIDADRITYVGPHTGFKARTEIDVKGQAIAPGFINMLAHPEESLLVDSRALSDLRQGVTLEDRKSVV